MAESKNLLLSKSFWGVLMSVVATVATMLHFNFGDADGWANAVLGLIGSALALYGRIVAVKKIG